MRPPRQLRTLQAPTRRSAAASRSLKRHGSKLTAPSLVSVVQEAPQSFGTPTSATFLPRTFEHICLMSCRSMKAPTWSWRLSTKPIHADIVNTSKRADSFQDGQHNLYLNGTQTQIHKTWSPSNSTKGRHARPPYVNTYDKTTVSNALKTRTLTSARTHFSFCDAKQKGFALNLHGLDH